MRDHPPKEMLDVGQLFEDLQLLGIFEPELVVDGSVVCQEVLTGWQ